MSGLEDVLATHTYVPCAEHNATIHVWWAQCEGCDWRGPRRSYRKSDERDHRAHVADALRAHLTSDETVDRAARAILDSDLANGYAADAWDDGADHAWLRNNARAALTAATEDA